MLKVRKGLRMYIVKYSKVLFVGWCVSLLIGIIAVTLVQLNHSKEQSGKSWTVLDERGNEYTGLVRMQMQAGSHAATFSTPEGKQLKFHGNFTVFEE